MACRAEPVALPVIVDDANSVPVGELAAEPTGAHAAPRGCLVTLGASLLGVLPNTPNQWASKVRCPGVHPVANAVRHGSQPDWT
jgi:hypothetical protein